MGKCRFTTFRAAGAETGGQAGARKKIFARQYQTSDQIFHDENSNGFPCAPACAGESCDTGIMPLVDYRTILTIPRVTSVNLMGIIARVPHAATSVILTIHIVQTLGRGYGAAGLAIGVWTVGMAFGSPWRGRLVDQRGMRRALAPSILAEVAVWGSAPWLPYELLLIAVLIGGIFALPAFTIIRLALSHLVGREHHRTAFALDSVVIELSFVIGPALGVLLALRSTPAALISLGACAAVAGLGLILLDPPMRAADLEPTAEPTARKTGLIGFQVTQPLLAVLAGAIGVTLVLAGTDVALIAALRATDELRWTGVVAGAWAGASIIGGLVYGALPRTIGPFTQLLWLALFTIPVGLASGPLWLSVAILPAGLLCAAALSATTEVLTELVPEETRGEAMGWHGSALLIGTAIGAPMAGFAIDHLAIWAGFAVVGIAGAGLAAGGLLALRASGEVRDPISSPGR